MTTITKKAFEWNEETETLAAAQYTGDNSAKALTAIAQEVGAKSGQAVRSKLVNMGVYVKAEKVGKRAASGKQTKAQIVDTVCANLGLAKETLDSLASGNMAALESLLTATTPAVTEEAES